jgi:rhamnose utilization protein RhaD (predicted bifunctional aldolase and dehydrogenase)
MKPNTDDIIALSRYYGRSPEWVIAGGGNTSVKNDEVLMIKASGTSLGTASPKSFVAIDRRKLAPVWTKRYPDDVDARESEALQDLMDARLEGESLRPSVETGMHDVFPQRLVVHTHPTLVNGLTCSRDGAAVARELFGEEIIWIPSINPGYVLSKRAEEEIQEFTERFGHLPELLFLENHGLTVAGETPEEIHRLHRRVTEALLQRVKREPDLAGADIDLEYAERVKVALAESFRRVAGAEAVILFDTTAELLARAASTESIRPVLGPFSPDHIVYAGHAPLYVESSGEAADLFERAANEHGVPPKSVVVKGLGLFTVGPSHKVAETARMLFRDAVKVARYAESFGGPKAMAPGEVEFIRGWEVERFRANVSLGGS